MLLVVSLLVFTLIHAAPGGPLALYLDNPNVRPQDIERLRHAMGLDRPLTTQYFTWAWSFLRGDWGYGYADGRPVLDRLLERVPALRAGRATSAARCVRRWRSRSRVVCAPAESASGGSCCATRSPMRSCRSRPWCCSTRRSWRRAPWSPRASSPGPESAASSPK